MAVAVKDLKGARVDTVDEPAGRRADNLHAKTFEANQASGLAKPPPGAAKVASSMDQAELPTY